MTTDGIEAVFLETHNWGRSAKFFQALGYELEFETDHNSGQLRNGDGPSVFIAEVPPDQPTGTRLVLQVPDADAFDPDPIVEVVTPFAGHALGHAGDDRAGPRRASVEPAGTGTQMSTAPDSSAVRTALWRALHVEVDAPPHLIEDTIGLALAEPNPGWRDRPDMHPEGTRSYRAAIVARTRFVEDLLVEGDATQYVLLGAGLDTFAQRHAADAGRVHVFEVDQPGPQTWKRRRLDELGYGVPPHLHLVPVDFETDDDWWQALVDAGFDPGQTTVVYSSGVSMYISKDATTTTLGRLGGLAPGSTVVMTFMLPFDLVDEAERPALEGAARGARASGTPWISFYTPDEIATIAHEAGFPRVRCVPTTELAEPYLARRADDLHAAGGEAVLLAET